MYPSSLIFSIQHQHRHCVNVKGNPIHVKAIRSFQLFPLLPPELRLAIWKTIASEPRNVELSCTPTFNDTTANGQWFSHTRPPILKSICSESRSYAHLRYAILSFPETLLGRPCEKTVYIDFESEALWLCGDLHPKWAADLLQKNEQLHKRLKHMTVDAFLWRKLEAMDSGPTMDGGYQRPDSKAVVHCLKELEITTFHS
jgi:hypothetical protein